MNGWLRAWLAFLALFAVAVFVNELRLWRTGHETFRWVEWLAKKLGVKP